MAGSICNLKWSGCFEIQSISQGATSDLYIAENHDSASALQASYIAATFCSGLLAIAVAMTPLQFAVEMAVASTVVAAAAALPPFCKAEAYA